MRRRFTLVLVGAVLAACTAGPSGDDLGGDTPGPEVTETDPGANDGADPAEGEEDSADQGEGTEGDDEPPIDPATVAAIEPYTDPPAESLMLACRQEGDNLVLDVRNEGEHQAGVAVDALLVDPDNAVVALLIERSRPLLPADDVFSPARGAIPLDPGQGGETEFPLPPGVEGPHRFLMSVPEEMDTDDQVRRTASCDIDVELVEATP